MHEDKKIKEAGFYLTEMHARQNDPDAFIHLLSGFLTAARSATQYAHKEVTPPKGTPATPGKLWYDATISSPAYTVLAFLKQERDINVHAKPVSPKAIISVEAVTTLFVSGSADYSVAFVDSEGKEVKRTGSPEPPAQAPAPQYAPAPPSYRYEFHGWSGPEDVLTLCDQGYRQLMSFVNDGQAKGFLTR